MKKIIGLGLLAILCIALATGCFSQKDFVGEKISDEVLRIHIRANSNGDDDQKVKYKVKSVVVDYITPLLVGVTDKQNAMDKIRQNLDEISDIAMTTLHKNGFRYSARAKLARESFPTRSYEKLTLPSGEYDALVLELGEAKGDNWWCVVYPPLCFVGGTDVGFNNIVYQSKLKEIIENFFKKHQN